MADASESESSCDRSDEDSFLDDMAGRVASMEPVSPDLLRATPAWQVLQSFGAALRWTPKGLYERSFPVSWIQVFWSHSWHGNNSMKTLLLLLLYNGPAAAISATVTALLTMCLHIAGLLPGVLRVSTTPLDRGIEMVFGPWCTLSAGLVFVVVLLLWKSRCLVFFDQICIDQTNPDQKTRGIIGIGAMVKYSQHFLLVWDCTYAGRLWCLLELAAFLKSHEQPEKKVTIRLTAMAPCILGIGFALWASMLQVLVHERSAWDTLVLVLSRWVFLYMAASYMRDHYRNAEVLLKQLSDFTIRDAACHCCNDGEICCADVCDRAIIGRCIQSWHGSVEAFEVTIRTRVRQMLYRQLGGLLFPYGWQVLGALPLFWSFADLSAARARDGHWKMAALVFLAGLTWCLFLFPFVFQATLLLASFFRRKQSHVWLDRLKTMVVAFVLTALSFVGQWTSRLVEDASSSALWMMGSIILAMTSWLALRYQARQTQAEGMVSTNVVAHQEAETGKHCADHCVVGHETVSV
ncbi:mask [Symbiodinium microadriaticum]|nr:mask [Symbiodinium microadriaticum]